MTQECMGTVGFHRINCGGEGVSLVGSSLRHPNVIALKIYKAEYDRHLNGDYYFPKKELIEVFLSPAQFAELLTTMNVGSGVPCTISRYNGAGVPEFISVDDEELYRTEFIDGVDAIVDADNGLREKALGLLKKQSLSKADRATIESALIYGEKRIKDLIPFINKRFSERITKTVTEAKAAVEAFVTHAVQKTGLESMANSFAAMLPEKKDK